MSNPNNTTSPSSQQVYFASSTELADLGRERFDHDTAAMGDRDFALYSQQPVIVQSGHAPKGLEKQVFEWNTFQYTTQERNDREELKGDLHEGQLHRQNRAAREDGRGAEMGGYGGMDMGAARGGGGRGRGRGGRGGQMDALCAGRKPERDAPPLAKGFAEEMDKSMFWDEPIV